MIVFLIGVPKSGKSYYMVEQAEKLSSEIETEKLDKNEFELIKDYISDFKEKDNLFIITRPRYNKILHNVAGYKNHTFIKSDEFKKNIYELYILFKKVENNIDKDTILLDKIKDYEWFLSYIMIDECHTILNNQSASILWFLSYHAHFHLDILFATQNIALINYKYKSFAETFIQAVPSSLRLFKNKFVYRHFPTAQCRSDQESNIETLKAKNDIFELYQSGKGGNTSTTVRYLVGIIIFACISVIYGFYSVITSFSSDKNSVEKIISVDKNISKENRVIPIHLNTYSQNKKLKGDFKNYNYLYDFLVCRFDRCHFVKNDIEIFRKMTKYLLSKDNILDIEQSLDTSQYKRYTLRFTPADLVHFKDNALLKIIKKDNIIQETNKDIKDDVFSKFPTSE